MLSVEVTDILKRYVAELVRSMPLNWESIVVYTEFLRSPGGSEPDCADIGMYVAGGEVVRNFRTPLPAHLALRELFGACEGGEDNWVGLRIEIFRNGRYKSKFYYEGNPLLEGNLSEVDKRIASE